MRRNDLWNLGRGCNSRRSLRPDSGLAWTAGIRPRSIGGRPNADDSLQSRAARFGHIDRSHSLRWASPRRQCVYLCRSRPPEPTLRPDRWFLSVCHPKADRGPGRSPRGESHSSQISQELDGGGEVALVDLGVTREGHFFQRPKTGLELNRAVLYSVAWHSIRHGGPLERHGGRYNAPPLASRHRLQTLGT